MGCVSSSLLNQDEDFSHLTTNFSHHIVSLTSTTYGLLTMEPPTPVEPPPSRRKTLNTLFPSPLSEPHSLKFDSIESISSWDLLPGPDYRSFSKKTTSPLLKDRVFDGKNVSLIEKFEKFEENSFLEKPTSQLPNDRVFDEINVSLVEKFDKICPVNEENSVSKNPTSQLPKDSVFDQKNVSKIEKFEKICPPNGENKAVMYSTTLRGVRKTFEDCNAVRAAVEGHGVLVSERDVSMDRGFREELRVLMHGKGDGEVTLPRLFVKGRYIGGMEEVMRALEEGYLGEMLEGLPKVVRGYVCEGCGGVRFLPCFTCSGSCKRVVEGVKDGVEVDGKEVSGDVVVKCGDCNENGLVHCPVCT